MNLDQHDRAAATADAGRDGIVYPNFDVIRLVAASAVIFSHAFLIAEGSERREPFVQALGPHNIAGVFGVHVFFIISGFLVARSLRLSRSVPRYLLKRFLRIYPGLFCCAVFVAIGIGPLFSMIDPADYFAGSSWLSYIGWTVALPSAQWAIEAVSFYDDGNLIGEIVNGSLWTIPHEILCYLILGGFQLGRLFRPLPLVLFALGCAGLGYAGLGVPGGWLSNFLFATPGFFFGAAFSFHPEWKQPGARLMLLSVCGLGLCALSGTLLWGFPIFAAYPLLKLCMSRWIKLPEIRRFGDITYGAYLYGWPMEQIVRSLLGDHATWWLVFLGALPLAYLCGYVSWHAIEAPALRLGRRRAVVAAPRTGPVGERAAVTVADAITASIAARPVATTANA